MLPTQLHIGRRITRLHTPTDNTYTIPTKPPCAFWTVDKDDTPSIHHLLTHIGVDDTTHHTLHPVRIPEPRVFDLSDIHALWRQLTKWRFVPLMNRLHDDPRAKITQVLHVFLQHGAEIWTTIAEMYDAVRLTAHPSAPGFVHRMGWDIPSTAWLRPQTHLRITHIHTPKHCGA